LAASNVRDKPILIFRIYRSIAFTKDCRFVIIGSAVWTEAISFIFGVVIVNKFIRRVLTGTIVLAGMSITVFGMSIKVEAFTFNEDFEFESKKDSAGKFIGFQTNTPKANGWLGGNFSMPADDSGNPFFTSLTYLEPELELDRTPGGGFTWEEIFNESLAPNTGKTWLAADYNAVGPQTDSNLDGVIDADELAGTIDAWLVSPLLPMQNGAEISFFTKAWTQTEATRGANYLPPAENLEVRFSTVEDGEFNFNGKKLLAINPSQVPTEQGGYPTTWTQYKTKISGLDQATQGRILLRYFVTDAGPGRTNGNLIGLDTFSYNSPDSVPTPALLPGLLAIAYKTHRKRKHQAIA
jgi:hypothetical protein